MVGQTFYIGWSTLTDNNGQFISVNSDLRFCQCNLFCPNMPYLKCNYMNPQPKEVWRLKKNVVVVNPFLTSLQVTTMETLRAQFQSYAANFLLDPKFLQDGLVLLSRVIDIESSSRNSIVFHPQHPPIHSVLNSCENLVYLKVWDQSQQSVFDEEAGRLILSRSAKLYAGQTQNFQVRERSRQGYLRALGDATWNICYMHSLENQYQRDAFEVAHIAYNFVMFGTQQLNKSPFGRYWYNNIDPHADIDSITANQYTRYSGWTAWHNTCLVGSAPPPTFFSNPNYLELLEREPSPLIDFTQFPPSAWGGLARFLDNIGVDQPHFVDHYPGMPCDRMHDWDPIVSTMDKVNADHQLRAMLNHHGLTLAVMLGHRPTRLAAEGGSANYLSRLGGKLTATRLPNGRVALLLWIIDPSHSRFINPALTAYDQIFDFVPIVVNTLEMAMRSIGGVNISIENERLGSTGLSFDQAQTIIAWYSTSLVGTQLITLMEEYRKQLIHLRDNQADNSGPLSLGLVCYGFSCFYSGLPVNTIFRHSVPPSVGARQSSLSFSL